MKRMRIHVLMFCLLFCLTAMAEGERDSEHQTQTIAHRGDWRPEGSAQNSRASLRRALEQGIFGSEIDVWLTLDGHIMVDHDGKRDGLSLQDTTFAACRHLLLSNGEIMPQLKDLLKILKKSKSPTRLVVEIKRHRDPQRSRECAAAVVRAICRRHLQDRVLYISFSPEACQTIHQLQPGADIAYLGGDRTPAELHALGLTGLDYNIKVFRQHPEWVQQAHDLGMNVNVWTVNEPDDIREMRDLGVDFITTDHPAVCQQMVAEPKK